jgi:rhodanese-related sulfurtransferase
MSTDSARREASRVDAATLKEWLHDGGEIALFDVREHGQYGESHLFYGICAPYSRLESDVLRLAPRKSVRTVVYDDDGDSVAPRAAQRLAALGYSDVHVLQGGTRAWKAAGLALFAGVNLPSKTFGELVEETYKTPRVSAAELAAMLERKDDLVVLDGRPLPEFRKMNIPTAICCPNGELALRVRELVPDESTSIVINCAGRTRSIIGAQTLINLGLPNPVLALQNGTQGWFLADLPLEHGNTRHYGEPTATREMREAALALARRFEVNVVSAETVRKWAAEGERSLFLCDVRTPEEFAAGTLPGARHAPGGQLLQACDQFVGVRHARIVLFDSDGIRALTTASWLRQMGHEASVLEGGLTSGLALRGVEETLPVPPSGIDAATLARQLSAGEVVAIDVRPSMQFRQSHIPGSRWSIRPRLAAAVAGDRRPVVLIADEPAVAACAALELQSLGVMHQVLAGGLAAWREAGLPLQASEHMPPDRECIDFLFFVHDRHDGNKEAARQYLAWETGLVAQLDARERAEFRLGAAAR